MDKKLLRKITFEGHDIRTPSLMLTHYVIREDNSPELHQITVQYSNSWNENTFWFDCPTNALQALAHCAAEAALGHEPAVEYEDCIRCTIQI